MIRNYLLLAACLPAVDDQASTFLHVGMQEVPNVVFMSGPLVSFQVYAIIRALCHSDLASLAVTMIMTTWESLGEAWLVDGKQIVKPIAQRILRRAIYFV